MVVAVTLAGIAPRIVGAVRRTDRALVGAGARVHLGDLADGRHRLGVVAGVGHRRRDVFYASDATLAWNRFVRPLRHGHLAVMVTYHLGQIGLVLGLL